MSFQDDVHQAVDIGFGLADLLGGIFGGFAVEHVLHTSVAGSQVTLSLNDQIQPVISCTGPSTTFAVVVPTTTQAQPSSIVGDVTAQPLIVQGGQQILFDNFPNFTKGMLTATQIDTTQPVGQFGTPVAAATLRNFSSASQVPLMTQTTTSGGSQTTLPLLSVSVGPTSYTVQNADENFPYLFEATITTSSPNQTVTLGGVVEAGNQTTTQFPAGFHSAVIAQMTIVASAVPQSGYTITPTPGSYPIPPS
jgi:hypothetical protein